ncbi:MAG: formimidoylglutamate deiminase [Burkholderiaceae bacterium]
MAENHRENYRDNAREPATRLWAPRAWIEGRWFDAVLLEVAADGTWARVTPEATRTVGMHVLDGPALPGLVNAHSHAFQRAFAGLAERRDAARDDFWSWRDRMYRVALAIGVEQLEAVATQLYVELLRGGYTQVCEFHYLHHAPDGAHAGDDLAMARALVRAATRAGIGLTLLPVLYERAGFAQPALRDDQRRFASTADDVLRWRDAVRALGAPRIGAGVAIHSLRAARRESIVELVRRCKGDAGPIHVHVAEQTAEVDDCVAATAERPIGWLAQHIGLDARWQLVHATHAQRAEIEAVARSGAGIVLCPSTEANLGDGLCDLPGWLGSEVPIAIGSDSHVTRAWREELRLLDYGQRLALRRRNVSAAPERAQPSTAQRLFDAACAGGARAAGFSRWGLQPGAPADLLVIDTADAALLGVPPEALLDALVFSSPGRPLRDVMVAGRWVHRAHGRSDAAAIAGAFVQAMHRLHAGA